MPSATIPPEVLALVGPDTEERTGEGPSRVLAGRGLVAKESAELALR